MEAAGTFADVIDGADTSAPVTHQRQNLRWWMIWCMKRINIYLAEGQAAALDRVAEAEGVSRAELIRELIDRAIGGHPGADLAADLAAIDDSFGIIAGQEAFSRATVAT